MNKEIVFKLKTQGFFSRENGFTLTRHLPFPCLGKIAAVWTVIKFTDGTWQLKIGRKSVKDRYSSSYKFFKESLEKTLGIQL